MNELTASQLKAFIRDGFARIDQAFPPQLADACRLTLWSATGCDPNDRSTWTQPVIRIGELDLPPFVAVANTPILHTAFDQLVGKDRWIPRLSLGSFPIRFPSDQPAGDTGWHVDASFPGHDADNYLNWRINVHSKGRGLLMLFLFSDVSPDDAPTRIRVGSHIDVARLLAPEGEAGLSFMELAEKLDQIPHRDEVLAVGTAGTVYLCHPFLAHAASDHHGSYPKFMAQPPLLLKKPFDITRPDNELSPVEKAIVMGIDVNTADIDAR